MGITNDFLGLFKRESPEEYRARVIALVDQKATSEELKLLERIFTDEKARETVNNYKNLI